MVCFDAPAAEGQAEAQAGAIGASLLERAEQVVDMSAWHRRIHPRSTSTRSAAPTRSVTGAVRPGELNAFLQQVSNDCSKTDRSASIAASSSSAITVKLMPRAVASVQAGGRLQTVGYKPHPVLDALGETDLGERASDEVA